MATTPPAKGRGSGGGAAGQDGRSPSSAQLQRASGWVDEREDSAINTLAALAADNPELQAEIEELCRKYSYEMAALEDTDPAGYTIPTPVAPVPEDAGRYSESDPERTPTVVIAPPRTKRKR
jgi:hypothetical protein